MNGPMILLDIQMQKDLFQPGGALYGRPNSLAAGNVYRLFQWAKATAAPVVSAVLLVRPGRRGPFGRPQHCVEGSGGEAKLARTLLPSRANLGLAHTADLPRDLFNQVQQVIFETRDPNVFRHQKFERLITELPTEYTVIICGAAVALGVKQAAIGLLARRFRVVVAEDAVLDLGLPRTRMAWLQIMTKGARLLTTSQIIREFTPQHLSGPLGRQVAAG